MAVLPSPEAGTAATILAGVRQAWSSVFVFVLFATYVGVGALAARFRHDRLLTVPATELALRHIGRPIPNPVLLGAFCAASGTVSLAALEQAIRERFTGETARGNVAAAREAHEWVASEMRELAGATAD